MNYGGVYVPYALDVRFRPVHECCLVTYLCSYERSIGRPRRSDRLLPLVWCERLSRLPTEMWSSFENPALTEPNQRHAQHASHLVCAHLHISWPYWSCTITGRGRLGGLYLPLKSPTLQGVVSTCIFLLVGGQHTESVRYHPRLRR